MWRKKNRRIPNIADDMLPEIVAGQSREILRAQAATVSEHGNDFSYRYNLPYFLDQEEVVIAGANEGRGVSLLYTHRLFDDDHDMVAIRVLSHSTNSAETFGFRDIFVDYMDRVWELKKDLAFDDQEPLRLGPASREILQLLRTLQGVMIQHRDLSFN